MILSKPPLPFGAIGFDGSTTIFPTMVLRYLATNSFMTLNQRARTMTSALASASSTGNASTRPTSFCASSRASATLGCETITLSPPAARFAATLEPIFPRPITAVFMTRLLFALGAQDRDGTDPRAVAVAREPAGSAEHLHEGALHGSHVRHAAT